MSEHLETQSSSRRIRTEAADWFAVMRSSEFSAETQRQFEQWLAQDPLHELAYEQCRTLWEMTKSLRDDIDLRRELNAARQAKPQSDNASGVSSSRWYNSLRGAAAMVVLVGAAMGYFALVPGTEHYETRVGEQRLVKLSDGSTATLNTNTIINVTYSDKQRRIDLVKGEAFFTVSKNKARPFEVITATGLVRAVGTAFNVNVMPQGMAVDVTEGIVQLEAPTAEHPAAQVLGEIKHGESAEFHRGDNRLHLQAAHTARIKAWQSGKLYFDAVQLADAVAEFNRYTKSIIVVSDAELNNRQISGIFNMGDTDTFVFGIEQGLNARAERKQDKIFISKK